jgi:S-adenosylmethionine decarboxylase
MKNLTTTFGEHYLVDLHGCDPMTIESVQPTEEALLNAATRCGSTIIQHHFHQFSPHGVTGIILIAESHISVHTWPENGFAAVDIFTSGQNMKPEVAIAILEDAFRAERVNVKCITRGALEADRVLRAVP